ncbi:DNA-directed RNA polymerase III RPC6 [Cryptosporidium sp. chipmunk genotype I]|uniref:DNA-directed RNA polymerase III RPC6 n=1 Tax=Cryptosporidium sp. chipmunk genotype I TaxID=1280935 RepID=UPI00351A1229|nr:DNA-directed RNA polymerase III RPC6 [Cryptosporidium sp. chipmunk genotype I]
MSQPGGAGESKAQITAAILQEAYIHGCQNNNELSPDSLKSLGWENSVIVRVLNIFTEKRLCSVKKNKSSGLLSSTNNKVVFQLRTEEVACKLNKLSNEEYLVFCSIEDAGNQGIWTADIRKNTGLQTHVVQRAVKVLCNDWNLIRPVKSIHVKNRKVYILASLEPSKELSGGTFYENGEFDMAFVDSIKEKIISFIDSKRKSTLQEILEFINYDINMDSSSARKNISLSDLQSVINMLIVELKILCVKGGSSNSNEIFFMCLKWPESLSVTPEAEDVPCLACPVFETCSWSFESQILPCPQLCKYIDYSLNNCKPLLPQ